MTSTATRANPSEDSMPRPVKPRALSEHVAQLVRMQLQIESDAELKPAQRRSLSNALGTAIVEFQKVMAK